MGCGTVRTWRRAGSSRVAPQLLVVRDSLGLAPPQHQVVPRVQPAGGVSRRVRVEVERGARWSEQSKSNGSINHNELFRE